MKKLAVLATALCLLLAVSCAAPKTETATVTATEHQTVTTTETTTVTETVAAGAPGFYGALARLKEDVTGLTVYRYSYPDSKFSFAPGDPVAAQITEMVGHSILNRTVNRASVQVENGQTRTVEVTWLYPRGIIMVFDLADGTSLFFQCSDALYLETEEAMYGGSAAPGLWELLSDTVGPTSG